MSPPKVFDALLVVRGLLALEKNECGCRLAICTNVHPNTEISTSTLSPPTPTHPQLCDVYQATDGSHVLIGSAYRWDYDNRLANALQAQVCVLVCGI